jgi:serine/threonine-protein kinase
MSDDIGPGARVGDYVLDRPLGQGGMGKVFAAHHHATGARVAIKMMHAEDLEDPAAVKRFLREARTAGSLDHPNVARVYGQGQLDDGAPYLVLELLEGEPLDAVIRGRPRLPVSEAVNILLQACHGVAAVHARGIVHRDLKPGNLFVVQQPSGPVVKVLDFGISKVRKNPFSDTTSLTRPGSMLGSPQYMSPEQLKDARGVDERTDVWALGLILFRLLTRRLPFEAQTVGELFAKVHTAAPTRLRTLREDVPPELEAIVHTCLAKKPEDRFETVDDLTAALAPFADYDEARANTDTVAESPPSEGAEDPSDDATTVRSGDDGGTTVKTVHMAGSAESVRKPVNTQALAAVAITILVAFATATVFFGDSGETSAPTPDEPTTVAILIDVRPPTAHVELDGRPIDASQPQRLPRKREKHTIVVSAPGHQTSEREVFATENHKLVIELSPLTDSPRQPEEALSPRGPVARAALRHVSVFTTPSHVTAAVGEIVNVGDTPIDTPYATVTLFDHTGEEVTAGRCELPFVHDLPPNGSVPCQLVLPEPGEWLKYQAVAGFATDDGTPHKAALLTTSHVSWRSKKDGFEVSGDVTNESTFAPRDPDVVVGLYDDDIVGAGSGRIEGELRPGSRTSFTVTVSHTVRAPRTARAWVYGYRR